MKKYFVLLKKTVIENNNVWEIEFGDYDKQAVQEEFEDQRDHGVPKKNLKIITCGDKQEEIDMAISKENGYKFLSVKRGDEITLKIGSMNFRRIVSDVVGFAVYLSCGGDAYDRRTGKVWGSNSTDKMISVE